MWHVFRDDRTHAWRWWQTATDGTLLKRSSAAFSLFLEAYEDAKRHGCTGMPDFALSDDAIKGTPPQACVNSFVRDGNECAALSAGFQGRISASLGGPGGDRPRIYIDEEWERVYWSETFGVSAERLKRVLREIGDDAEVVKRYFQARRAAGERWKA